MEEQLVRDVSNICSMVTIQLYNWCPDSLIFSVKVISIVTHVPTFDLYTLSWNIYTFHSCLRFVFEQPGLELLPEEDQAGVSLGGCLREQHALLHQHRAGASPGTV